MFNPHPPLTAFPTALLCVIVVAESIYLLKRIPTARTIAHVMVLSLAVISPVTYYSGYLAAEHASLTFEIDPALIATHQGIAKLYLLLLFPTVLFSILERSPESTPVIRGLYYFSLLIAVTVGLVCSYHGGKLVFGHGAGVYAPIPSTPTP